jgi:hypothetical protein
MGENNMVKLEELVLDRNGALVGKDRKGSYKVIELDVGRPLFITMDLSHRRLYGLTKSNNDYIDDNSGRKVSDLVSCRRNIYRDFRKQLAERLTEFPNLGYHAYLTGPSLATENDLGVKLAVPVSPIQVKNIERWYFPVGAKFARNDWENGIF